MSRRGWLTHWGGDIAFGGVLSLLSVASAAGLTGSNAGSPRSGTVAAVTALTMVAPVVVARRYPIIAAVAIGAGALLNALAIGDLVRCGTALPAVFYVAFVIGMRSTGWPRVMLGALALVLNLVCQANTDPQLGVGVLVYMVPIAAGFGVGGGVWRRRRAQVARLRVENARLRDQRDANARLAVAADRARIADDFSSFLARGVDKIDVAAATGLSRIHHEPERAEQVFLDIQSTGRTALTRMREVLTDLGGESPVAAGAMVGQLDRLVAKTTDGRARLSVDGDPRLVPPQLELSAYRIVERLLEDLDHRSGAGPEVTIAFDAHELRLTVAGNSQTTSRAAVAVAQERVSVHGGTLRRSLHNGRRTTVVHLPLAAGHV